MRKVPSFCAWVIGLILVLQADPGGAAPSARDQLQANLVEGRAALEDGFYELARSRLVDYIDAAPDRASKAMGTVYLAECMHGMGRYEQVLSMLTARHAWAAGTEAAGGFAYWMARAHLSGGDPIAGLEVLASFEERFPDSPFGAPVWRLRARTLAAQNRLQEAIDAFAGFDERYADRPEAAENLLDWAEALRLRGAPEDVIPVLRRLVREHSASDAAQTGRLRLGDLLIEQGDREEAMAVLTELGDMADAVPALRSDAWLAAAALHEQTTNLTAAVAALRKAAEITVDPVRRAEILRRTGHLSIRQGERDTGLAQLQEAVSAAQDTDRAADMQLFYAESLQELGLHQRAAEAFQQYLEAFPDPTGQRRAQWGRGWSLWELQRYPEAAALFESAYQRSEDPDFRSQALFKMADSYLAEGQHQRAAGAYQEFLGVFPDHELAPKAYSNQVEALHRAGDRTGALVLLQAQIDSGGDPEGIGRAWMRKALLHRDAEEWGRVEEIYSRVHEMDPEGELGLEALCRRGTARYAQGRFAEALADFRKVADRAEGTRWGEEAHYMRGWSLYMLGEDAEALAICQAFIEQYPDSALAPRVLFWLGEYYWNHGFHAEAEARFLACAESDPSGPLVDKALFWAGRAMERQSDYLRAKDHINRLVREHPDTPLMAEIRLLQGDVLTQLGLPAEAILALDEIIKKWPESYLLNRALIRKGQCQFTLGVPGVEGNVRYEQALASFRAVAESATATPELQLRARSMMGQCLEKLGRAEEAFDAYMKVVYQYLAQWTAGDATGAGWFTSAAFKAAALMESRDNWGEALRIYRRVVDTGVPAAQEARKRIQKIRLEHWQLF